jgi:hypothetical protein
MEGHEMNQSYIDLGLQVVPWVLVFISQGAAIFGKPAIVAAVKPLSTLFDALAANYLRSTNLHK